MSTTSNIMEQGLANEDKHLCEDNEIHNKYRMIQNLDPLFEVLYIVKPT